MAGSFTDAIEAGQLAELHVPKIEWASTVTLMYRAGEQLIPDAHLLRDAMRDATRYRSSIHDRLPERHLNTPWSVAAVTVE